MAEKDMDLNKFCQTTQQDIEKFRVHWIMNHQENPEQWPMEMGEGDWFDQFLSYVSTE